MLRDSGLAFENPENLKKKKSQQKPKIWRQTPTKVTLLIVVHLFRRHENFKAQLAKLMVRTPTGY